MTTQRRPHRVVGVCFSLLSQDQSEGPCFVEGAEQALLAALDASIETFDVSTAVRELIAIAGFFAGELGAESVARTIRQVLEKFLTKLEALNVGSGVVDSKTATLRRFRRLLGSTGPALAPRSPRTGMPLYAVRTQ